MKAIGRLQELLLLNSMSSGNPVILLEMFKVHRDLSVVLFLFLFSTVDHLDFKKSVELTMAESMKSFQGEQLLFDTDFFWQ